MAHEDTVRLLRECNAGIKMGIDSLEQVIPRTDGAGLGATLRRATARHEGLREEARTLLTHYREPDRRPSAMIKGMSRIKTAGKLLVSPGDKTVASLMTDGCHMGIKSVSHYLNAYPTADDAAKTLAKKLISLEDDMARELRSYL